MDNVFQEVLNTVIDYLPENWERVAIYFARVNSMIDFNYYVDDGKGYESAYTRKEYNSDDYNELTLDLNDLLMAERDKLPKKKQWSVFTMFVQSSGKFKVDYSYDNISKTFLEYKEKWEQEYIINK